MPIYKKIQQVMQKVRGVGKDSYNTHSRYKYAGHEAVTDALRDHFAEFGIVRQASASDCEVLPGGIVKMTVHVSYIDAEDESRIDLDMPAVQPSQTTGKTVTAQQIGQAVSYAVKNIEFKLFALTGDPEPDSDSLPVDAPPPRVERPPAQQRPKNGGYQSSIVREQTPHDPETGEIQEEGDHFAGLDDDEERALPTFKTGRQHLEAIEKCLTMTELDRLDRAYQRDKPKMSEKTSTVLFNAIVKKVENLTHGDRQA